MTSTLDRPANSPFEEVPVGGTTLETFDFNSRGDSVALEPVFRSRPSGKLLTSIGLVALVITALCAEVAYVVADLQPNVWAARSQIQYQGATWVETQSERVNSRSLLEPIALAEGIPIDEFEAAWTGGQVLGTEILQFEYASEDPDQALAVVEQVTNRYLAEFQADADEVPAALLDYQALEKQYSDQIAASAALVEELSDELGANGQPKPAYNAALQSLQTDRASLNAVRLQIAGFGVFNRGIQTPELVTDPFLLSQPVAPLPGKRAIFGLIGGMALATAFVFVALRIAATRR